MIARGIFSTAIRTLTLVRRSQVMLEVLGNGTSRDWRTFGALTRPARPWRRRLSAGDSTRPARPWDHQRTLGTATRPARLWDHQTTLGGVGVEGDPRPDCGHPFLLQQCPADIMPLESATSPPNPRKLGSRPRRLGDRLGPGARGPGRGVRYYSSKCLLFYFSTFLLF